MLDINELKVGSKVYYQPSHYPEDKWENGIVKEIPTHTKSSVRVVYNCGEDWENYQNYTSAMTDLRDLKLGWKSKKIMNKHQQLDDILFPVVKVPTNEFLGMHNWAENMSNAIYLLDQNKIVQICGSSYKLVDNEYLLGTIYDRLLSTFGQNGFTTKVESEDDRRFFVKFIIEDRRFELVKGDDLCPVIEVHNSYDGSVKQKIGLGYYRVICTNGLMAFTETFGSVKKHSTGIGVVNIKPILEQLDKLDERIDRFKRLTEREIDPWEYDIIMKDLQSEKVDYPKKLVETALEVINRETNQFGETNGWLLYNGFNNALYHSDMKMSPVDREKIDRRVLSTIEGVLI